MPGNTVDKDLACPQFRDKLIQLFEHITEGRQFDIIQPVIHSRVFQDRKR